MGMVGDKPMWAWSVGVTGQVGDGRTAMASIFTIAATPGEAVAVAVRHLFDSLTDQNGNTPLITITATQATRIARDVIEAAASELGISDKQPR